MQDSVSDIGLNEFVTLAKIKSFYPVQGQPYCADPHNLVLVCVPQLPHLSEQVVHALHGDQSPSVGQQEAVEMAGSDDVEEIGIQTIWLLLFFPAL